MNASDVMPALRWGEPYESLDTVELTDLAGSGVLARVSQVNAGIIKRDVKRARASRRILEEISTAAMFKIFQDAAERFIKGELPDSPETFVRKLSGTTGLPHALCQANMKKIYRAMTEMPSVIRGLTRGLGKEILDRRGGHQDGVDLSYYPQCECLGAVLPSNSPGVHSLWLPALALRIPVLLKPGREDPWTPSRIIAALTAAGCPKEAFGFYPSDHEGAEAVLNCCGRSLVFGGDATVERYRNDPRIEVHGAGRSKILIGDDLVDRWPEFIDVIFDSIADNGGRSCINASGVWVPRHGDAIAAALADRLAALEPKPLDDPDARLAGFANPKMAEAIDAMVDEGLRQPGAEDFTAARRTGPRREELQGIHYLRPTLIRCASRDHALANREFLFPFASVVECPVGEMPSAIGPTLVATAITADPDFSRDLLESAFIDRLNFGPIPTTRVQWDQPHEGNLFEFLFHRRAIQRAALP